MATGGGAVVRGVNWGYLHHGIVVWLDGPPELLARRAVGDGTAKRPMLAQAGAAAQARQRPAVQCVQACQCCKAAAVCAILACAMQLGGLPASGRCYVGACQMAVGTTAPSLIHSSMTFSASDQSAGGLSSAAARRRRAASMRPWWRVSRACCSSVASATRRPTCACPWQPGPAASRTRARPPRW